MDTRIFGWGAILAGAALFFLGIGLMIFGISAVQIAHLSQFPGSSINQVTAETSWLTNAGVWLIIPGALLMLLGYVFGLVVYEKPLATNIQPPNTTSMSAPRPPTASGIAPKAQAPANQPSRGRAVQPAKKKENTPPMKKKTNPSQSRKHNFGVRAAFLGVIMVFFGALARFKPDIFAKTAERIRHLSSADHLHKTTP